MKKLQIIMLFAVLLLSSTSLLSQTRLDGTFVSRLENPNLVNGPGFRFEFTKDGRFIYVVYTDCVPFPYGRGTYTIDKDYLTLSFETIPYSERDTLFVQKRVNVDSNTFLDSIRYKFTIFSTDSLPSNGVKVCFLDPNNKALGVDVIGFPCREQDSPKPLIVSFPYKLVPFKFRIYYCLLYVTSFTVLDYYNREISISFKKDWAQEHDFLNAGDIIRYKIKNVSDTSFYMWVGAYWYHCKKQK